MHQTDPGIQTGTTIPGFEAGADRLQRGRIAAQIGAAEFQQIGHDLRGQIDLIVHDHVLQILDRQRAFFAQLSQTIKRKSRAQAQRLSVLTDQR